MNIFDSPKNHAGLSHKLTRKIRLALTGRIALECGPIILAVLSGDVQSPHMKHLPQQSFLGSARAELVRACKLKVSTGACFPFLLQLHHDF